MDIKKMVGLSITAAILMANVVIANAAYTDVSGYAEASINALVEQGVLTGEGEFNGAGKATRAFVIEVMAKSKGLEAVTPEKPTFSDVPASHSAFGLIEAAYKAGWVKGDTDKDGKELGTFRPEAEINRAELAKILTLSNEIEVVAVASPYFTDTPAAEWYTPYVQAAYKWSIVNGYSDTEGKSLKKYGPADFLIRQDTVVAVVNAQNKKEREIPQTDEENTEEPVVSGEGSIKVKYNVAATELAKVDFKNTRHGEGVYTGTLPAPEGTIVSGMVGMDVTLIPSGEGVYQFENQIWMAESLACRDGVRTIKGSTGKAFEDAWWAGFNTGLADFNLILSPYDNTVPTEYSAKADVYKEGYDVGYYDNAPFSAKYVCGDVSKEDIDNANYLTEMLADYDEDGWLVYAPDELTDMTVSVSVPPMMMQDNDQDNPYKSNTQAAYTLDVLNYTDAALTDEIKLDALHFAQFLAGETDTMEKLLAAIKADLDPLVGQKKAGSSCIVADYAIRGLETPVGDGYVTTTYNACSEPGVTIEDQKNYIAITESYSVLIDGKYVFMAMPTFDSRIDLDGSIDFQTEINAKKFGSDFYDQAFVDQFFDKLSK